MESSGDKAETVVNLKQLDTAADPIIIEPDSVQEILVDGILNIAVTNGTIRLGLFAERTDFSANSIRRVLVARVVMSTETASAISDSLKFVLQRMVDDGVIAPLIPVSVRNE